MLETNWLQRVQSLLAANAKEEEVRVAKSELKQLTDAAAKHLTLYEVGKLIASERELEKLLRLAMDKVIEMTGAQRGFIALLDKDGHFDFKVARRFEQEDIASPATALSRTVIAKVREENTAFFSPNAMEDKRLPPSVSILGMRLLSVLCAPIRHQKRIAGVIYLDHLDRPDIFDEAKADLLGAFSEQVAIALENAHAFADLRQSHQTLVNALREKFKIIGFSPAMAEIIEKVDQIANANTEATVLIEGESGTGKELIAKALHSHNRTRCRHEFVALNCGAIPKDLIEKELFGYVSEAFTGALKGGKGKFEQAEGGTILLDEIGDAPLDVQVKLLRVLQEREYSPVGSAETKRCNVRVLAATNRNLKQMVENKDFREDLYYRLNVIPLKIPPLRERHEDILPLIEHFLIVFSKGLDQERPRLSPAAKQLLLDYDYPGNIRELENIIARAVILSQNGVIAAEQLQLPKAMAPPRHSIGDDLPDPPTADLPSSFSARGKLILQEWEREQIRAALRHENGNQSKAAKRLGLAASELSRKMGQYALRAKE